MDLRRGLKLRQKRTRILEALPEPPTTDADWLLGLLMTAHAVGASDLDLTETAPPVFHVDGEVVPLYDEQSPMSEWETPPLDQALEPLLPRKVLEPVIRREQFEADLSLDVRQLGVRFRINLYYQQGRLSAVFRLIPSSPRPFKELGLSERVLEAATRTRGLFLVTGTTGSGKSTTLASIVEHINRTRYVKIITIEDPVEFIYEPKRAYIVQREVGTDTKSFFDALRAALRQAPHVILLGEMRDPETIEMALTAAETGHLVLATLHTNSAVEAVHRIVDAFPGSRQGTVRSILASVLNAVLAQELVPRRNGTGRVLVYELLEGTQAVRNLIRQGKVEELPNLMLTEQATNHVLRESIVDRLVQRGEIDPSLLQTL